MAALTAVRNTPKQGTGPLPMLIELPVAASTKIFQGSIVCSNASGLAVPGSTSTTQKCWGRAEETADNSSGAASAINVKVQAGVFQFANSSAGDLIAQADVGALCYIVDDQTVAKTDGTGTRSKAGIVISVDSLGVWVCMAPGVGL